MALHCGVKTVVGVVPEKPIVGFLDAHTQYRLRMRAAKPAMLIIRNRKNKTTSAHYLIDKGHIWHVGPEFGRNQKLEVFDLSKVVPDARTLQ